MGSVTPPPAHPPPATRALQPHKPWPVRTAAPMRARVRMQLPVCFHESPQTQKYNQAFLFKILLLFPSFLYFFLLLSFFHLFLFYFFLGKHKDTFLTPQTDRYHLNNLSLQTHQGFKIAPFPSTKGCVEVGLGERFSLLY